MQLHMLTDWLADKTGEEVGVIERRWGELVVCRENLEILLTSPLPPSPLHTSHLWMNSPISLRGSQISLVLRKAEPPPPFFVCLVSHLPFPHLLLCLLSHSTPFFLSEWDTIHVGTRGALLTIPIRFGALVTHRHFLLSSIRSTFARLLQWEVNGNRQRSLMVGHWA